MLCTEERADGEMCDVLTLNAWEGNNADDVREERRNRLRPAPAKSALLRPQESDRDEQDSVRSEGVDLGQVEDDEEAALEVIFVTFSLQLSRPFDGTFGPEKQAFPGG